MRQFKLFKCLLSAELSSSQLRLKELVTCLNDD